MGFGIIRLIVKSNCKSIITTEFQISDLSNFQPVFFLIFSRRGYKL